MSGHGPSRKRFKAHDTSTRSTWLLAKALAAGGLSSLAYGAMAKKPTNAQLRAGKRRLNRNYSGGRRNELRVVKKKVKLIQQQNQLASHTRRLRDAGYKLANELVCNTSFYQCNNLSITEAALSSLRFFNPAVPGTLTTADGKTGTYARSYYFQSVHSKVTMRNNAKVAGRMTIYVCVPKKDGSVSTTTCIASAVADQGANAAYTATSPLTFPTDGLEFNDLWKIVDSKSRTLEGG